MSKPAKRLTAREPFEVECAVRVALDVIVLINVPFELSIKNIRPLANRRSLTATGSDDGSPMHGIKET